MQQFNMALEKLGKLPRAQRLLVFVLAYVLLCVGFWFGLYGPARASLGDLKEERRELMVERKTVKARVADKAAYEKELQDLTKALKKALLELPNNREIPGLLKGISALGKKSGLEMRKFQPLPEIKSDYTAQVPVALEVQGSFHEVAMFFDRLSKQNRIVYVDDVEMGEAVERSGKVTLTVRGKCVTYRFLSEEERAEMASSKGKKKKRKKGK